jgi:hypothetical protein
MDITVTFPASPTPDPITFTPDPGTVLYRHRLREIVRGMWTASALAAAPDGIFRVEAWRDDVNGGRLVEYEQIAEAAPATAPSAVFRPSA